MSPVCVTTQRGGLCDNKEKGSIEKVSGCGKCTKATFLRHPTRTAFGILQTNRFLKAVKNLPVLACELIGYLQQTFVQVRFRVYDDYRMNSEQ